MKDKTLKQLVESIKASSQPKTSAYDTSATVTRIENGVAWVHIPGGVRETPVKLTIAAKAGDNVQVRVSGGRAFMVGNATAPPTDDRVATQALTETKTINKVVKAVQAAADKAARVAGNTNQYFWHTSTGSDTGAHITEIPQEEFLADPTNGGGNLLARSNGIAVRDGLEELAYFSANGAQVGKNASNHLTMTNAGLTGVSENGVEMFKIWSGDYSGTTKITETSGVIENTNTDKTTFPSYTYVPVADPVDLTNITVSVTVISSSANTQGGVVNRTGMITRLYDESDQDLYAQDILWTGTSLRVRLNWNGSEKSISIRASTTDGTIIESIQVSVTLTALNPTVPSYTFGLRSGTRAEEGAYSFVGGTQNIASGEASAVFGVENVVGGMGSASFGTQNTVTGNYGFASGQGNVVTGDYATALGAHLIVQTSHQTVLGHYNIADENNQYAFIIGNGDVSERKNVFTVAWSGETRLMGQYVYLYSFDNTERQYRIINQAYIDGLTYADDGIYPHSCDIYGGNGASPVGIGAWDLAHGHHIWRYNDDAQYLDLYNSIRVDGKAIPLKDMCNASGDTWAVDYAGGGYVTNGGKKFQWSVPTPHINGTPTVTACTGFIRQNGNYLLGTSSTAGQIPIGNITVDKLAGFVRITYDATSAPSEVVNNHVIGLQLHITFTVT